MNEKKSFLQMRIAELPFITIIFLIVMCFNFYVMTPMFFTMSNITNIAIQMAFILLLGMGQALVILSGNLDLSIGAVMGTSAMILGVLVERGVSLGIAIMAALAFCLVIGGINGFLVARCKCLLPNVKSKFVTLVLLKLPSIVITYIMMRVVIGLGRWMSENGRMISLGEEFRLERSTFLTIFFLVLVLLIVLWIILEVSKAGKGIYALGNALDLKELPVKDVIVKTVKCYIISALFAGLAGLYLMCRIGAVSPLLGVGVMEFTILTAIIGGISFRGGQGIFIGVLIGVTFEQVLRTGLVILGVDFQLIRTFTLVVLIVFAVINTGQSILIRRAREKIPQETPSTTTEDKI
jgi:ribose transport system permease protein